MACPGRAQGPTPPGLQLLSEAGSGGPRGLGGVLHPPAGPGPRVLSCVSFCWGQPARGRPGVCGSQAAGMACKTNAVSWTSPWWEAASRYVLSVGSGGDGLSPRSRPLFPPLPRPTGPHRCYRAVLAPGGGIPGLASGPAAVSPATLEARPPLEEGCGLREAEGLPRAPQLALPTGAPAPSGSAQAPGETAARETLRKEQILRVGVALGGLQGKVADPTSLPTSPPVWKARILPSACPRLRPYPVPPLPG